MNFLFVDRANYKLFISLLLNKKMEQIIKQEIYYLLNVKFLSEVSMKSENHITAFNVFLFE